MSSLTALKPRSKKWHLEPVSITKISKKDLGAREPHTVSNVKESHSVFSNINGNRHGFKQDHQQGKAFLNTFGLLLEKEKPQPNILKPVATACVISKMINSFEEIN